MSETRWPLVELRQYTLHPGTRDTLIDLFDREFVETQEAVGMRIVGQFRDEDDPDRFVWMRAFRDMPSRRAALTAFYLEGEPWRTHAPAARATMVDTTDARLLHPLPGTGDLAADAVRPDPGATEAPKSRVLARIYYADAPAPVFADFFESRIRPILTATGADTLACYETDPSPNDFPHLPLRTDQVFVHLTRFDTVDHLSDHLTALRSSRVWTDDVVPDLSILLAAPTDYLRLAPTARSLLR
ncbi:NIPSNAP family protein [Nocardia transvalensis]|uniref:NIPSNAP family protein n=1 Tax=Nocardia transvalensis TaxID=37333 RepID=UPI001893D765|nr:NIPSNAP family protein [Nocardia transvalensis]MBF6330702.1 NIPSNAP family protein [Nocardia transvalensis]